MDRADVAASLTAARYIEALKRHRSSAEAQRLARHLASGSKDAFLGVRMGRVFAISKEFKDLPPGEIAKLLKSRFHEVRAGGLKIMALQAASRRTEEHRRKELFELYLSRSDRIDNWDLVDVAAPDVIGRYLLDKPRTVLTKLARSPDPWERRTAIVSTLFLIRRGEVEETFRIARILVREGHELVQKATGGVLREAGKRDRPRLVEFLDRHASAMSRVALRDATERLDQRQRSKFLGKATPRARTGTRST
jgi:3-methyladenine DNA glycosylase AlkD